MQNRCLAVPEETLAHIDPCGLGWRKVPFKMAVNLIY